MRKYKIVDRKRFTLFIIISFCLISLIGFVFLNSKKAEGSIFEKNYFEHYIIDGDTLWNIALDYMPKRYDVRKMVYEIKEINGLETSFIFPGEIIKIPIMDNTSSR